MKKTILCRTLLGRKNIDFSIECLKSLIEKSFHPVRLEIFEDGSLLAEDIKKIESLLENSIVITKKERDEIITQKLAGFKKCMEYRAMNVLAFKIFDTMLYSTDDFFYVDSDVYFVQKFTFPDFEGYPIFMMDSMSAYVFKPFNFFSVKTSILPFVNTGFMYYPNKFYKIDFIEYLLNDYYSQSAMYHHWSEQTLWAFLGAYNKRSYFFDKTQVILSSHNLKLTEKVLCVHLITPARYQFEYVKKESLKLKQDDNYIKIETTGIKRRLSSFKYLSAWVFNKYKSGLRMARSRINNLNPVIYNTPVKRISKS